MKDLAYYDGRFAPIDEMTIPLRDRAHFFGDGVYEVAMARNYTIYALDEHIERFYRSAAALEINFPYGKDELAELLCSLVKKLDSHEQNVYWQVTRGYGKEVREHTYSDEVQGKLWVMLRPSRIKDIYAPVKAITLPDTRWHHCNIKSTNLIPSVMYAQKANRQGAYEAILYREGGRVTECSHSNVHIVTKDGVFRTAPADNLILAGIARSHLIRACHSLGIEVNESPFTLNEMMSADEIILSSTSGMCMVCESIDGISVGGKNKSVVDALRHWVMRDFIEKTS
jgi:D-alanine transaminase